MNRDDVKAAGAFEDAVTGHVVERDRDHAALFEGSVTASQPLAGTPGRSVFSLRTNTSVEPSRAMMSNSSDAPPPIPARNNGASTPLKLFAGEIFARFSNDHASATHDVQLVAKIGLRARD